MLGVSLFLDFPLGPVDQNSGPTGGHGVAPIRKRAATLQALGADRTRRARQRVIRQTIEANASACVERLGRLAPVEFELAFTNEAA